MCIYTGIYHSVAPDTDFLPFQVNRKQMTEKIDELMVSNLTQIAERVNLNMEVYTNLLYQIYKDEQVIDSVTALTDDQETHKAVAVQPDCKKNETIPQQRCGDPLPEYYMSGWISCNI